MYNHNNNHNKSSFRDNGESKIAARSNKWRFWLEYETDNNNNTFASAAAAATSPRPDVIPTPALPINTTTITTTTTTTSTTNSNPIESENSLKEEITLVPVPEKPAVKEDYLKDLVSSPIFSNRATIIGFASMNCDDKSISKLLLFKSWIEPVWEDKHNLNGGRFFLRCPTRAAAKELFLRMVNMSMRGDLLPGDAYLCGLGFNSKKNSSECSVQLWHAQLPDSTAFNRLRAQMKHFHCSKVGYHPHSRSSVTNTHGGGGKGKKERREDLSEKPKLVLPEKFSVGEVQAAIEAAKALQKE